MGGREQKGTVRKTEDKGVRGREGEGAKQNRGKTCGEGARAPYRSFGCLLYEYRPGCVTALAAALAYPQQKTQLGGAGFTTQIQYNKKERRKNNQTNTSRASP